MWWFFLVIATVQTRPVLKRAWQGLSNEGGTQWEKSWGHDKKIMFSSPDLITWLFYHAPMTFPTVYPHLFEIPCHALFRSGILFTVYKTNKKFSAFKKIFDNFIHIFFFFFFFSTYPGQSGETSWWRVLLSMGLPRLVYYTLLHLMNCTSLHCIEIY